LQSATILSMVTGSAIGRAGYLPPRRARPRAAISPDFPQLHVNTM
jgi:hypothetical protein